MKKLKTQIVTLVIMTDVTVALVTELEKRVLRVLQNPNFSAKCLPNLSNFDQISPNFTKVYKSLPNFTKFNQIFTKVEQI